MRLIAASIGLAAVAAVAACASSGGGYVPAQVVFAEPPVASYRVGAERAVVVSRDVLVNRGFVVYRVDRDDQDRILWARRGGDILVRVFLRREGDRVAVRAVQECRDPDHARWVRRDPPRPVMADIDVGLRTL